MATPIRLAMVGAGLFTEEAHLPALQNLKDRFEIVAVCTRTQASAEKLAALIPHKVDITTDYNALVARDDIEAVNLVTPIGILPAQIEAALAAKKHVISEKPAAPDIASGRKLLALPRNSVWMVAENWRYAESFARAAQIVQSGVIGKPIMCHWAHHIAVHKGKYYATGWRRDNSFPGGFLLDGGVHHIAALRWILGEVAEVAAFASLTREDLPPYDTLSASLRFESGCLGSYIITYAGDSSYNEMLTIVGEKGALKVTGWQLDTSGVPGVTGETVQKFNTTMVQNELADFADAIQSGKTPVGTPEQALNDVAVIEAMLSSAETKRSIAPECVV